MCFNIKWKKTNNYFYQIKIGDIHNAKNEQDYLLKI